MKRSLWLTWLIVACLCGSLTFPALAHDPSLSGIRILYRRNDVVVNVTTHISRLREAEGKGQMTLSTAELDQAVRRRLHIRFDGKAWIPGGVNVIGDNTNDLLSWQAVVTAPVRECEVAERLYPEDGSSRTVVTILRDGQVIRETLLEETHPDLLRAQPPPGPLDTARRYVREGIGHIFGGQDHVLFVLGLILLGGRLKSLLKTVTAFTLAHSVTLSVAATGVWNPSPRIVEPLIALSIVAIAVENLRHLWKRRPMNHISTPSAPDKAEETAPQIRLARDLRYWFAFGFGLVHGFGFAGALAEIGLPKSSLWTALATFNIGVEVGQVAIILTALPILNFLAKSRPVLLKRMEFAAAVCIGIAGAYWFLARIHPA